MKTIISAKHIQLTDATKNTINSRLESLCTHFPNIMKATCFVKRHTHGTIVEILISGKKLSKFSKANTNNLYLSIHEAIDKIQVQLERTYSKRASDDHVLQKKERVLEFKKQNSIQT